MKRRTRVPKKEIKHAGFGVDDYVKMSAMVTGGSLSDNDYGFNLISDVDPDGSESLNSDEGDRRCSAMALSNDLLINHALDIPIFDSTSAWRKINDEKLSKLDGGSQDNNTYENDEGSLDLQSIISKSLAEFFFFNHVLLIPILTTKSVGGEIRKLPLNKKLSTIKKEFGDNIEISKILIRSKFEISDNKITDVLSDDFEMPVYYKIGGKRIHHSRVISYKSPDNMSRVEKLSYYTNHLHERINEVTRSCKESNFLILKSDFEWILRLMTSAIETSSQNENTMDGVTDFIAKRVANLRENANNDNAYAIDKNSEDIQNIPKTNITQMDKATRSAVELVCSVTGIPAVRFLGHELVSSWGSNSVIMSYIQNLHSFRNKFCDPLIRKVDIFISEIYGIDDLSYEWNIMPIEALEMIEKCEKTTVEDGSNV